MSHHYHILVDGLKRILKSHGYTYADIAAKIDLSEASVKRLFANKNMSLERLESICNIVGMDISGLVASLDQQQPNVLSLTYEQEETLISDTKLLLVAVLVLKRWTFKEIIETYQISETECIQKLALLDRLQIIQLQPNNGIRLKVSPNFSWIKKGPIQTFFQSQVQQHFFQSPFDQKGEQLLFSFGMLSPSSNATLIKRMQQLIEEFQQHSKTDESLSLDEKFGTTLVMAIRPWEHPGFSQYRRRPNTKKMP